MATEFFWEHQNWDIKQQPLGQFWTVFIIIIIFFFQTQLFQNGTVSIIRYKVPTQVGCLERASLYHWLTDCCCTQEPQISIKFHVGKLHEKAAELLKLYIKLDNFTHFMWGCTCILMQECLHLSSVHISSFYQAWF
jgi:hypothetical protein